jgi:hypothetical protein
MRNLMGGALKVNQRKKYIVKGIILVISGRLVFRI